jgi:hypothetical protein
MASVVCVCVYVCVWHSYEPAAAHVTTGRTQSVDGKAMSHFQARTHARSYPPQGERSDDRMLARGAASR